MTYSIAACDLDAGQWGVATQSKFLAVGSVVPWAEPGVGAVATQAYANPRYGPEGSRCCAAGSARRRSWRTLVDADDGREHRQLGVVDAQRRRRDATPARSASTGRAGTTGPGFAAQGNILVSGETVDALAQTFSRPRARRSPSGCSTALDAAQAAGGDRRGQQSAALLVVETRRRLRGPVATSSSTCASTTTTAPLDGAAPASTACTSCSSARRPPTSGSTSTTSSPPSSRERLARLGYDGPLDEAFDTWAGTENLEERVSGVERIDPVVLEELRRR